MSRNKATRGIKEFEGIQAVTRSVGSRSLYIDGVCIVNQPLGHGGQLAVNESSLNRPVPGSLGVGWRWKGLGELARWSNSPLLVIGGLVCTGLA